MSMCWSEYHRAVDWRWKQAQEMRLRSAITVDSCFAIDFINSEPYLRLAHELICLLTRDELRLIHAVQRKKVSKELEYAVMAYGIHRKKTLMNWVVQAMALADAPSEVRTALLGRDELYFDIHLALFYDVADRLEDETYIWNHGINTDPKQGLTTGNAPSVLLECAYLGGWQRFLVLLGSVMQNFPGYSQNRLWTSCPILGSYCGTSKVSKLVREVIEKRLLPEEGRTIDDLRKLYESIPVYGGDTGTSTSRKTQTPWDCDQVSTCFAIVDDQLGQRRRLPAQLLSK